MNRQAIKEANNAVFCFLFVIFVIFIHATLFALPIYIAVKFSNSGWLLLYLPLSAGIIWVGYYLKYNKLSDEDEEEN